MNYYDGSPTRLGDIVTVPIPTGTARARIVMIGDTYEHLDIDPEFVSWVKSDNVLRPDCVVVEWLNANPFATTIRDTRQWETFTLLHWMNAWSVLPNPPLELTASLRGE